MNQTSMMDQWEEEENTERAITELLAEMPPGDFKIVWEQAHAGEDEDEE